MPDLLAHALLAYAVCRGLAWRYTWLTSAHVTAGMAGAFIPDLAKVALVLPGTTIEGWLGLPFSWYGLHTLGGALVGVAVGAAVVADRDRRRVAALLAVGAASHLLADALLLTPTGRSYAVLWPLTRWHPPTPGLYLSTDPGPTLVAGAVALVMWAIHRGRS